MTTGEKYRVDLLVETTLQDEEGVILVHSEQQAQFQNEFMDRMFVYFTRLYEKYRRKIIPIVVFSMGYTDEERMQVRLEFLRMMTRLRIDPARMELIGGFFETYLSLEKHEEEQVQRTLHELYPQEEAKVMEIISSWRRMGREEGIEQGRLEAMKEVAKEMLESGISVEQVAHFTKLDVDVVAKL